MEVINKRVEIIERRKKARIYWEDHQEEGPEKEHFTIILPSILLLYFISIKSNNSLHVNPFAPSLIIIPFGALSTTTYIQILFIINPSITS